MCPHGVRGRSVHRGQEATGSLVESESPVLPGRVLTESCQTLHVAPDRAWIRLVLLRQRVSLHGLLARQIKSLHNRIKHRVARRTELQGDGPLEQSAYPALTLGTINLLLMVASGVPNHFMKRAAERLDINRTRLWILVCLAFGVLFSLCAGSSYGRSARCGTAMPTARSSG
jgi:heme/copper-type cytochrome/quinol oxidase subunit 3